MITVSLAEKHPIQCGRFIAQILTGYGEGETIAEYGTHVVRRDAVIHAGVLPPRTMNAEVMPCNELSVVEGYTVFEPFVLWLWIACESVIK